MARFFYPITAPSIQNKAKANCCTCRKSHCARTARSPHARERVNCPFRWMNSREKETPHKTKTLTLAILASFTCTPALSPVPRLDGQVRIYPRCWFHMNSCPWRLMSRSTSLRPRQKRSNTDFMSPPFSIEMTRVWSSSFNQIRKFLSLLCQIPRASGQSRAMPAHVRSGDTGLSNRKWSSINCCCSAAVMPFSG